MYFRSSALEVPSLAKTLKDAWRSPNKSPQAYWGLYPFDWQLDWQDCFETERSTGCYLLYTKGGIVNSASFLLTPVALSSVEAKYNAAAHTMQAVANQRQIF